MLTSCQVMLSCKLPVSSLQIIIYIPFQHNLFLQKSVPSGSSSWLLNIVELDLLQATLLSISRHIDMGADEAYIWVSIKTRFTRRKYLLENFLAGTPLSNISSISSRLLPAVSGRKKKTHIVAQTDNPP